MAVATCMDNQLPEGVGLIRQDLGLEARPTLALQALLHPSLSEPTPLGPPAQPLGPLPLWQVSHPQLQTGSRLPGPLAPEFLPLEFARLGLQVWGRPHCALHRWLELPLLGVSSQASSLQALASHPSNRPWAVLA